MIKTDVDLFFKKIVRKELLPVDTREGIEQRIYNLPKAGIIAKQEIFSKNRENLQREVLSVAASFSAYSIYHGQFTVEKRENEKFFIPVYSYIPKEKRVRK